MIRVSDVMESEIWRNTDTSNRCIDTYVEFSTSTLCLQNYISDTNIRVPRSIGIRPLHTRLRLRNGQQLCIYSGFFPNSSNDFYRFSRYWAEAYILSPAFRYFKQALRRKFSPITGIKYSLLAKIDVDRRTSVEDHKRVSRFPMCSSASLQLHSLRRTFTWKL